MKYGLTLAAAVLIGFCFLGISHASHMDWDMNNEEMGNMMNEEGGMMGNTMMKMNMYRR